MKRYWLNLYSIYRIMKEKAAMVGEKIRSVSSHFIKLPRWLLHPLLVWFCYSVPSYPRTLLILFLSIVLHATLVPLSSYSHHHSYMSPRIIGFVILALCALLLSIQSMLSISYLSLTFYLSNFIFTLCFLILLLCPATPCLFLPNHPAHLSKNFWPTTHGTLESLILFTR